MQEMVGQICLEQDASFALHIQSHADQQLNGQLQRNHAQSLA